MSETLHTWLAGAQDFAQGVALYEQHPAARPALLALLHRAGAGPFTTRQLVQEIERLAAELPAPVRPAPATGPAASTADRPPEVAALEAERLTLFKASSNHHAVLRYLPSDEARHLAAKTILENFARGEEIWDALAYHEQHGALPPPVVSAVEDDDPAALTTRRNTLRTYLSSKRGTPEKRAAWQAEIAQLERRLQP